MAVEIQREMLLGGGGRGFRFALRPDVESDRKAYEAGRKLETTHRKKGSFGQKIFGLLSDATPRPTK